jgi:DNA-binding GntR family transcriptional regulator
MAASKARHDIGYRKLADRIADVLQRMIVTGELESGRKITQDELAEMLGVSTMPIREALLKLTAVGLVESFPNRSFRVVTTTSDDMRDLYWIHATLASELTRRACEGHGKALAPRLRSIEDEYDAAAAAHDADGLERANTALHREINKSAQAPRLLFLLKTTLRSVPDGWYPQIKDWVPLSRAAHSRIIEAFEKADANAAAVAAFDHVVEAGDLVVAHFAETGRWAQGPTPVSVD